MNGPSLPADALKDLSSENLLNVLIETNDSGPIGDDFFFVLTLLDGQQVRIPLEEHERCHDLFNRLPGFDFDRQIEATGSTENRWFVCWDKDRPSGWFPFDRRSLEDRLHRLLAASGSENEAFSCTKEVLARLDEPHRRYHTLRHVHDMLVELSGLSGQVQDGNAVELAIWYHDVVYDPARRKDNEARSAGLFRNHALRLELSSETVEKTTKMIRLTAQYPTPQAVSGDDALFLDLDLSILSATPFRFCAYEKDVWLEFRHIPWPMRAYFRKRFLKRLLKTRIYHSAPFEGNREQRARTALQVLLSSWPRYRWML